ncbi:uncharacterized protein PGTG_00110 [Puccinia graminis f. sp. tritici CRL 75-36-700-3]|uniref:DUF7918 domain-containing protein n=1 Tax=Puccinia graminis f. sp. tritici (strain CRL 75-36-700-3 / race SCCL) TaxID=418459 RepID=E3JQT2_PUCGT|nr:uncharacterized protein PGTG_00110 [Puccinia graminis f. sp. tritici CRL 75-36-700-3]EFP74154.1 hypothetical protein PGTG_00110 [Puccinia graminis f. sp. tritici CRL 75-36-700-3]
MPINSASGASCQINLLQPSPSAGSPSIRTPCEEYDHQTTLDPTTGAIQEMVTIQSQQASPFGILIDIKPTAYSSLKQQQQQQQQQHPTNPPQSSTHDHQSVIIPEDYACKIILDGIWVGSYRHPKSASCSKKHITRIVPADGLTFQALQFAKLNLVDPDDYDDDNHQSLDETVIKALGTIQIDVFRCTLVAQPRCITTATTTIVPPVQPPTVTTNQMKFSERSKKARISTSAGLAQQAISRAPPSEMRWLDQSIDPFPFLQFIFKYKPRSILESEGILFAQPAPTVEFKPDPQDQIRSEQSSSIDNHHDCSRNDELEAHDHKRVKVEDDHGRVGDKKPEIIDLTGLDDL